MADTADLPLIDHHCHGLMLSDLTDDEFRSLATESEWPAPDGIDALDSPFGLAVRAICAPLLDIERNAPIDTYLDRRRALGVDEVNRRLLDAAGTARYLVDTGFTASPVAGPAQMRAMTGAPADEILRLERVAEEIAPGTTAENFAARFGEALYARSHGTVGLKSIIAYRYGFDIAAQRRRRPRSAPPRATGCAAANRAEPTGSTTPSCCSTSSGRVSGWDCPSSCTSDTATAMCSCSGPIRRG